MTDITLREHMLSGGGDFAYMYHIAGMPWAATNSTVLKDWLDADSADAQTMKRNLFGTITTYTSTYSAYDVEIISTLEHDQGTQTIKFDERKGIDVGGWNTSLRAGANGYQWTIDSNIAHTSGVLGLDFQPSVTTSGVVSGVLSRDFQPNQTTWKGDLYWFVDRDNGLKDLLSQGTYLWVGSSCLVVSGASVSTTLDQNEYYIECKARQFRSPNELILNKVIGSEQMIQITNVPLDVTGYTANLWAVPMAALTTSQTPILFRTGKVLTNPREGADEKFNISHSGFTGQLDYKASPDNAFRGNVTGYTFTRMETTKDTYYNDYGEMQQPHIWLWEFNFSTGAVKGAELWMNNMSELGSRRYETLDAVKSDVVAQIAANSSSNTFTYGASPTGTTLDLTYYLGDDGDLVWDKGSLTDDYYVFMFGPAAWVCGFGYCNINEIGTIVSDQTKNSSPFYSNPRARKNKGVPGAIPFKIEGQGGFRSVNWQAAKYWLALREYNDSDLSGLAMPSSSTVLTTPQFIKNKSTHTYYLQTDWQYAGNDGPDYVPKDNDGNRLVYFSAIGDRIAVESGDALSFGGKVGTGESISGTVNTVSSDGLSFSVDTEDTDGSTLSNRIKKFRYSMHWASGWQEEYGVQSEGGEVDLTTVDLSAVTTEFSAAAYLETIGDPYEMKDNQSPTSDNPWDLLKQLTGDFSIDVGVPRRSRCTTVQDLHGITGEKTLVDWAALQSLVGQSGIEGVSYGLDLNIDATGDEEETTVNENKGEKFSIKDAFINLCLTHGIRQVWEYNEAQRSWWLTFKPFTGDSVASASNSGRTLVDADIRPVGPSAITGGDWTYSNLDIKIRNQSGGTDVFKVDKAVGKNQHADGAKTLSINDVLTILPVGDSAAKDTIIKRVANYLEIYSKRSFVQKYQTTVRPLTNLSVGSGVTYTSATAVNRETGKRGIENGYADVLRMAINLGPQMGLNVDLRTSDGERLGIAPTLFVDTASRSDSVVSISGLATSASNNDFADPNGGLTDLAHFDCYEYSVSDGTVRAKSCSCGDYGVWIFERNEETLTDAGSSRNVWSGTIGNVNIASGTADITLDSTTNFDTVNSANGKFIVIFCDRDSADLQDCQKIYGWLGDSNGKVQDSGANDHAAITWI